MNVFCWLGWKEHTSVGPAGGDDLHRRGRTSGAAARRARRRPPRSRTRRGRPPRARSASRASSRCRYGRQRIALRRRRLVGRRGALHRRRHPRAAQGQAVVDRHRRRLVGEAGAVHRPVEPVAGAVAGEHPPGAVGAVGRRRQPEHQDASVGVAEAGNATAPVGPVAIRGPPFARHLLPPGHEPWATAAGGDLVGELRQRVVGRRGGRSGMFVPHATTLGWTFDMARRPPKTAPLHATLVLLVRHGQTTTTGTLLPGRAPDCTSPTRASSRPQQVAARIAELDRVDAVYAQPARAHPRDRRPDRQGPRAQGHDRARTARVRLRRVDRSGAEDAHEAPRVAAPCSATRAGSASPAARASPRCRPAWSAPSTSCAPRHKGGVVVAVSHADPIKALVAHALGTHLDLFQRIVISTVLGDGDRLRQRRARSC